MQPTTALLPALVVDPVDYVLIDIATGRHLPGDGIHAEQLVREHGLTLDDAMAALDDAWRLGLVARTASPTAGTVSWTPEVSQIQLHRLTRAMVSAVSADRRAGCEPAVIDADSKRLTVIELFGLTTLPDLDVFLEVARALLGGWVPTLVDELAMPLAVFFTENAQRVHGAIPAADTDVRVEIVGALVASLLDGRIADFQEHVADYVLALSTH